MLCVIGSHAINRQLFKQRGFSLRRPMDLDLVGTLEQVEDFVARHYSHVSQRYTIDNGSKLIVKADTSLLANSSILEVELVTAGSTAEALQNIILSDSATLRTANLAYASLDVCYMLKMTHRYLKDNPHFLKTMNDIHALRSLGATIRPEFAEFVKSRERATYRYSHPKLNQSKTNFFSGDGVEYVYDHDSVHESVKQGSQPAYTYFQSQQAEVMCDMNKFFELDRQIQLNAVYEESCVLALERSIVPFGSAYEPAFVIALEKVCTSITSGRFREFAWENYREVRSMYTHDTFNKFFSDVAAGLVAKHAA